LVNSQNKVSNSVSVGIGQVRLGWTPGVESTDESEWENAGKLHLGCWPRSLRVSDGHPIHPPSTDRRIEQTEQSANGGSPTTTTGNGPIRN
jgi:hypothetical protein